MTDVFASLIPVSWREIEFPIGNFRLGLGQDHVEHKYVYRDGAHIEAVGRAPLIFQARAYFRNGILRGPGEHWAGPLYPTVWREFFAAAADRTTGVLVHPELGPIHCKLRSADTAWDATARDGVDVDVTWVESSQDDMMVRGALAAASPIADAIQAAEAADAQLDDAALALLERLRGPGDESVSLGELVGKVQGVVDQATLLNHRIAGAMDSVVYKAQSLAASIDRAGNPKQWPVRRSAERLEAAMSDLKKTLFAGNDRIIAYTVRADRSLAAIAAELGRSVNDLVVLNPMLVRRPTVSAGTVIRYRANG